MLCPMISVNVARPRKSAPGACAENLTWLDAMPRQDAPGGPMESSRARLTVCPEQSGTECHLGSDGSSYRVFTGRQHRAAAHGRLVSSVQRDLSLGLGRPDGFQLPRIHAIQNGVLPLCAKRHAQTVVPPGIHAHREVLPLVDEDFDHAAVDKDS